MDFLFKFFFILKKISYNCHFFSFCISSQSHSLLLLCLLIPSFSALFLFLLIPSFSALFLFLLIPSYSALFLFLLIPSFSALFLFLLVPSFSALSLPLFLLSPPSSSHLSLTSLSPPCTIFLLSALSLPHPLSLPSSLCLFLHFNRMYRMPCNCREGYTGNNCQKEIARCTDTTCYPNVACNSSKPGNPCESCPLGMAGDGIKCYDINQCSKAVCSQKCKDLLGSNYICSCWPGYVLAADNKTCLDIDECKSVNNCTKEGQYCENNNGSYSCKCKAGYLLQNDTCISLKGKNKVDGSLVFSSIANSPQAWSEDLKNNSSPKFKALANIMKTSLLKVLPKDKSDILEVTSFEKVVSSQRRKKRSTNTDSIKGTYEVYGNNLNADQLKNSIQNSCQTPYCNLGGLSGVSSQSITVAAAPICKNSPCDLESTDCIEKNGYQCVCKPGFENWPPYNDIRCKDINECALTTKPCGSINCSNTVGSYTCVCDFGFVFKKTTKECVDVCSGNVCNEGICIRNANDFRCGCNDGWSGDRCDVKDQQSEKRRTDLILSSAGELLLPTKILTLEENTQTKEILSDSFTFFFFFFLLHIFSFLCHLFLCLHSSLIRFLPLPFFPRCLPPFLSALSPSLSFRVVSLPSFPRCLLPPFPRCLPSSLSALSPFLPFRVVSLPPFPRCLLPFLSVFSFATSLILSLSLASYLSLSLFISLFSLYIFLFLYFLFTSFLFLYFLFTSFLFHSC
ncbi:unnamed protein product [Acanthosepion pharaonis]|uniref:EGF-like domain-containing protein n=1 Tax=Acanthosepion pharaonis TaxID=158019 RepID=A0A812B5Q9_ACAPH|nr:unnamed protein product [Sepia pharaonis]